MNTEHKFWLVWNPARNAPTQRHFNRRKAQQEAERLARLSPGDQFYVLEAVSLTQKVDVSTIDLTEEVDDIPF